MKYYIILSNLYLYLSSSLSLSLILYTYKSLSVPSFKFKAGVLFVSPKTGTVNASNIYRAPKGWQSVPSCLDLLVGLLQASEKLWAFTRGDAET